MIHLTTSFLEENRRKGSASDEKEKEPGTVKIGSPYVLHVALILLSFENPHFRLLDGSYVTLYKIMRGDAAKENWV